MPLDFDPLGGPEKWSFSIKSSSPVQTAWNISKFMQKPCKRVVYEAFFFSGAESGAEQLEIFCFNYEAASVLISFNHYTFSKNFLANEQKVIIASLSKPNSF